MSFSEVKLFPVKHTTIKANGSFVYNGAVRISCTVMQGKNGLFVGLPREKYVKDGKDNWADKVFFTNENDRAEIQKTVLAAYNKMNGTTASDQGVSPEPASQVPAKKNLPAPPF